jgi:tetratricopeptide (TPR) repeat protein
MQALAPARSIAATEQVRKLCEGYFLFKSLGPTEVKGVSEPVNVYEVTGLGPLRTRLQRSAARGYTKFVGRQREMDALRHAAEQAGGGRGQIVAVVAEPGIGKSRLFDEFKTKNQSGWMVLEALSVPHGVASTFLPVIGLLRGYFKITADDDGRSRREKIKGKVLTLDRTLDDALPYLYSSLGLNEPNSPVAEVDPQTRKLRSMDAIKRILLRESLNQPLMVICEDLQGIDRETQAFLDLLADSIGTSKILLLVNYRHEYSHQWNSKTYYAQLRLDPLARESAEAMLSALLGEGEDLVQLKRLIIEKTEGNPLFMEEIYQALIEDGSFVREGAAVQLAKPLNNLKIPPTPQGILDSRIDRLPTGEKDLLQTLAVIGKMFPLKLVREVIKKPDDELNRILNNLQFAEFIYEQPAAGNIEYTFKHALIRDAAYNSVLVERRRLLHEQIGAALELLYSGSLDDHLAELAHHYTRSGSTLKAVEYCARACQQCSEQASYAEAVAHFDTGLTLLHKLPDDDRRAELELDLRIACWAALGKARGLASPEFLHSSARAVALSQRAKINWEKAWLALYSACFAELNRDVRRASELGAELVARAEAHGSPQHIARAIIQLSSLRVVAGHFDLAAKGYERGMALLKSSMKDLDPFAAFFGTLCLGDSGFNLWLLGYPDNALNKIKSARAFASESGSNLALEYAHYSAAFVHGLLGELEHARESAEAVLALATERGNAVHCAWSEAYLGWVQIEAGDLDRGIARMRRGASALRNTGAFGGIPYFLALMAAALERRGQHDEAFRVINESLEIGERIGDRLAEAEVHRLKGQLLLAQDSSNAARAETTFRTAITIARGQKARSWELRATVKLARLLRDTNRGDEARAMLAEIYNWFTEGFDTADLKDAKSLLDELSDREA